MAIACMPQARLCSVHIQQRRGRCEEALQRLARRKVHLCGTIASTMSTAHAMRTRPHEHARTRLTTLKGAHAYGNEHGAERAAGGSEARVGRREEARATYTQQATDVELVGLKFLEPAVRLSAEHLRLLALLKAPHQLLHAVLSTSTLPRTNEHARTG